MRRLVTIATVVLLAAAIPATTLAAVPDYQRVINARHADAVLTSVDGCVVTEVFVSGMDAVFGGRPGPINRQGLAGVLVRRIDLCTGSAAMHGLGIHAAGGTGGGVVFDGLGQTLDSLGSTVHFDAAWLRADVPMVNEVDGTSHLVSVDLRWSLVGELERDTGHLHVRVDGEGNVNSHQNTLAGDATVSGTVTIGSETISFASVEGGHLQQIRYGCQVVAHPSAGDPDLSC